MPNSISGRRVHGKRCPGGYRDLDLSGGRTLRIEVECLEAELADIGPAWATAAVPAHLEDIDAIPVDRIRTA
jgi:hypothetical protein